MWSRSFEGPPTPNDMVDVVDSAIAEGRNETAYRLAAALVDYWLKCPHRHDGVWMYGFDYWLGVRQVLGMQRARRHGAAAGRAHRRLQRSV